MTGRRLTFLGEPEFAILDWVQSDQDGVVIERHGRPEGMIQLAVDAGLAGAYRLLIPKGFMSELKRTRLSGEKLRAHIPERFLSDFIKDVERIDTEISSVYRDMPVITRVTELDTLISCAIHGNADIMVTMNRNLLLLGRVGSLSFLKPRDFVCLLQTQY